MTIKKNVLALGVRMLRMLPDMPVRMAVNAYTAVNRRRVQRRSVPESLIFFVTNRCNATCNHCFYWKELDADADELQLDEVEKLARSLRGVKEIVLTGGEPALRKDLFEVGRLFSENGIRRITVTTNGLLGNPIVSAASQLASLGQLEHLQVTVSLDGTKEIHDTRRNVPGAYDKAIQTIDALKDVAREYPVLRVSSNTTLADDNLPELATFLPELSKLEVTSMFSIARGTGFAVFGNDPAVRRDFNPRDMEPPTQLLGQLDQVQQIMEEHTRSNGRLNWNVFQRLKLEYTRKVMTGKKRIFDCLAGYRDAVIYNNGDVSFCEMTKPIGNLRDVAMDFGRLWRSEAANELRGKLRKCCCIHGCNIMSNMQFHGDTMFEIVRSDHPVG